MLARFKNMWEGFVPSSSPLLALVAQALGQPIEVTQDPKARVDIEVGSIFPSRRRYVSALVGSTFRRAFTRSEDIRYRLTDSGKSSNATMGIWFSGECTPSPASGWDCYLGYETFEDETRAYLPLWQLHSDLVGNGDRAFLGEPLSIASLLNGRAGRPADRRSMFCCAIIRNPHPLRLRAIEALSSLGAVDVFGPFAKRAVPNKLEVMRKYRFALAFENTLYPGYVTEKPFDAWSAGCIPLYWGLDDRGFLNEDAIIDFARFGSLEQGVGQVAALVDDTGIYESHWRSPLLRRRPLLEPVLEVIRRAAIRTGLV